MTRKHFESVAAVLANDMRYSAENNDAAAVMAVARVAHELAYEFARFNSNFDKTRFLRACGLDV